MNIKQMTRMLKGLTLAAMLGMVTVPAAQALPVYFDTSGAGVLSPSGELGVTVGQTFTIDLYLDSSALAIPFATTVSGYGLNLGSSLNLDASIAMPMVNGYGTAPFNPFGVFNPGLSFDNMYTPATSISFVGGSSVDFLLASIDLMATEAGLFDFGVEGAMLIGSPLAAGFSLEDLTINATSTVPEPGTVVLLGTGLLALAYWYRRNGHQAQQMELS